MNFLPVLHKIIALGSSALAWGIEAELLAVFQQRCLQVPGGQNLEFGRAGSEDDRAARIHYD